MYSEQLEAIIDAALADGVLTDKEREVLHKRAAQEGVDADELDVVIDGRLAKIKKEEDWLRPVPPVQPLMSNKMGNVMKCPSCGAAYEPGTVKCPECGHYFQNISANNSAKELADGIQKIMSEGGMGIFSRDKTLTKCVQFIKDFPIPNTKDDMLEFLITLDAKRKTKDVGLNFQGYYGDKYKEVVKKAQFLFPDDKQIQSAIDSTNKFSWENITYVQWCIIGLVIFFLICFVGCSVGLALGY